MLARRQKWDHKDKKCFFENRGEKDQKFYENKGSKMPRPKKNGDHMKMG